MMFLNEAAQEREERAAGQSANDVAQAHYACRVGSWMYFSDES